MIKIDKKTNPYGLSLPDKSLFFSDSDSLRKYVNVPEEETKPEPAPIPKKFIETKNIVIIAKEWIGYEFHPGQREQCAAFVRDVLYEAGFKIGQTQKPVDWSLLPEGSFLSAGYADSFAGDDIGLRITKTSDLLPGDIVLFKNTYGDWKPGVITHVGIYIGNGEFVHRPTANKPVQKDNLQAYGRFAEGRRLWK